MRLASSSFPTGGTPIEHFVQTRRILLKLLSVALRRRSLGAVTFCIRHFPLGAVIDAAFPGWKSHEVVLRIRWCRFDKKDESLINH